MLYFFISLIDFDWIEGHLISGQIGSVRIRIGSDRISFIFFQNQIRLSSNPDRSNEFLKSDWILPPLDEQPTNYHVHSNKTRKLFANNSFFIHSRMFYE
jgi:hypothetical protein